jgi:hypothetical protein
MPVAFQDRDISAHRRQVDPKDRGQRTYRRELGGTNGLQSLKLLKRQITATDFGRLADRYLPRHLRKQTRESFFLRHRMDCTMQVSGVKGAWGQSNA